MIYEDYSECYRAGRELTGQMKGEFFIDASWLVATVLFIIIFIILSISKKNVWKKLYYSLFFSSLGLTIINIFNYYPTGRKIIDFILENCEHTISNVKANFIPFVNLDVMFSNFEFNPDIFSGFVLVLIGIAIIGILLNLTIDKWKKRIFIIIGIPLLIEILKFIVGFTAPYQYINFNIDTLVFHTAILLITSIIISTNVSKTFKIKLNQEKQKLY